MRKHMPLNKHLRVVKKLVMKTNEIGRAIIFAAEKENNFFLHSARAMNIAKTEGSSVNLNST